MKAKNEKIVFPNGRGQDLAARLPMAELSRTWQLLLKGLGEVLTAPLPLAAAEMVLIRVVYAAGLPTPAELISEIKAGGPGGQTGGGTKAGPTEPRPTPSAPPSPTPTPPPSMGTRAPASMRVSGPNSMA